MLVYEAVLGFFRVAEFGVGVAVGGVERDALGCGAGGRVRDREHGHYGADDDAGCARAAGADQGVAVPVVRLHAYGGHGQVGAVDGDHGGLGEAGLRVVFLDCGVDGDGGDDEEDEEVDGYGGLVHAASGPREEDVHDYYHREGGGVHPQRGAD